MQVVPAGQAVPHMPQWVLLVWVLTQTVSPPPPPPWLAQRTCPTGQPCTVMQLPAAHTWLDAHMRPHMPQLRLLTLVLTHTSPQRVCPIGQARVHMPAAQLEPVGHTVPQLPQLVLLVWVLTQA